MAAVYIEDNGTVEGDNIVYKVTLQKLYTADSVSGIAVVYI